MMNDDDVDSARRLPTPSKSEEGGTAESVRVDFYSAPAAPAFDHHQFFTSTSFLPAAPTFDQHQSRQSEDVPSICTDF